MIILTSFENSKKLLKKQVFENVNVNTYSVSRKQPTGFSYIDLPFFAARDIHGNKLRLINGIEEYRRKLLEFYDTVYQSHIVPWVLDLRPGDIDIICCWCPYSESTKRQIRQYGSFVCHTGIIGSIVNDVNPEIEVYMDLDRHTKLISEYKPSNYKPLVM